MVGQIALQVGDVEDVRYVLSACQMFLNARDIMEAQIELNSVRPSPLSQDVERVLQKITYAYSQYLIEQRERELYGDVLDVEEDAEDDPGASEELAEGDLEVLPDAPLGQFEVPKQKGRRLTAADLSPEPDSEDEGDYHDGMGL